MECRAGTIYVRASLDWMAGLYGFFCFVFVAVGAVRLKWWGGGLAFFFHFLYFVVSFPGGRLSVVGYFVLRYWFSLGIFGTIAVLYVMSC